MEALVDIRGIARVLGIPESTVGYYIRKKGMPYIPVGKHKRFIPDEVIKWFRGLKEK